MLRLSDRHLTTELRESVTQQLSLDGRLFDQDRSPLLSRLALEAYRTVGGSDLSVVSRGVVAVECLLACSDLVDDLQDGEDLSHIGLPTVAERIATLHSLSHLALAGIPQTSPALVALVSGELRAIDGQRDELTGGADTPANALRVASRKSGGLGWSAARLGAVLGGCTGPTLESVSEFGELLATAAQLANDILGSWPWDPNARDADRDILTVPLAFANQQPVKADAIAVHPSAEAFRKTWLVTKSIIYKAARIAESVKLQHPNSDLIVLIGSER